MRTPKTPPPQPDTIAAATTVVDAGGCTAAATPDFAPVLRAQLAAGDPTRWPGFTAVKRSTVRTTMRGALGGVDVHVKVYRAVRWTDRARDLLRGARARVEFDHLRQARAAGLPVVEPLAFGTTHDAHAHSFLITRTVGDATPLARDAWPPATARALGQLLRHVHDAGLHAFDLHPGNVLVRGDGGLVLLDLTSVRFGEALAANERARGLAFFALDLAQGMRSPAAAALLDGYDASPLLRAAAAKAWRRLRQRALVAFGRRAMRACKHTAVDEPRRGLRVFRCLLAQARADAAVQRERELAQHAPDKSGRRGAVWMFADFVAKQRNHAAASRLFRAAYWLQFAGVPCPQPLALVLRRGHAVVMSERIPGHDLAARAAGGELTADVAVVAAARLGAAVGRLHAHGLRNRDLKFENLVLHAATGDVVMVDLDGVGRKSPHDRRGQANDLARLLAAFRTAGAPGGNWSVRAFVRSYTRARQCQGLRSKITKAMRRRIAARASGLASRSRRTNTS